MPRAGTQTAPTLDDPREQRFVAAYVETPNATQAALVAGYSPKSAAGTGYRLLKRAHIKRAIEVKNAAFLHRYAATPDRIVRELAKLGFSSMDDYARPTADGGLTIDFTGVSRDQMAALTSLEVEEFTDGKGDNARPVRRTRFKLADKKGALVELARLASMYPADRTELTGAGGGPIMTSNQHLSATVDLGTLQPEQRDQLRQTLLMLKQAREAE